MNDGPRSHALFDASAQLRLWPEAASGGSNHAWEVRESRRSRRLTVRVFGDGRVEIVVPRGTTPRTVASFVERHRAWIEGKVDHARAHAVPVEPFPPAAMQLAALDEEWRLVPAGCRGRQPLRMLAHGEIGLCEGFSPVAARRAVLRWLCERARERLGARLQSLSGEQQLAFRRLEIRRQRTRWGSCSTRGTITLNCALLFQPPAVVRYLMIHELVHTLHMNHSRRFWNEVARRAPDYRELDAQLLAGWKQVPSWFFAPGDAHG